MFRRCVVVASVVGLLVASTGWGQERRGPGRGGLGGFGRFGGLQATSMALLRIPEVREELGLGEQQIRQIEDLLADAQEQLRGNINFQELQQLSDEERARRFEEAAKRSEEINKQVDEKLSAILEGAQRERLSQLRLQREGVRALVRPDIARQLGLTEEQQDRIRAIQQDARATPGGQGFQDLSDDERREFFAQLRQRREKAEADMLAVLTDAQREQWKKLQGEAFDFPAPQRGFGFGGPGGQDGGPRRRPPRSQDN